jgi:hypothetical protein
MKSLKRHILYTDFFYFTPIFISDSCGRETAAGVMCDAARRRVNSALDSALKLRAFPSYTVCNHDWFFRSHASRFIGAFK